MEAVEVEYKETVIPEKKEVIVEKVTTEQGPESAPKIVKEVIITKEEPKEEKVPTKPNHTKKEEKTTKPIENEPKKDTLIFNPVKAEQIEIVKEKPKEESKKEIILEKSHNDFQIKTEAKPPVQPSTPDQQAQFPQMPYGYPYPMFMPPIDQKNQNGQLYYMLVPTYIPYDPKDQSKPKYPMYPYPQPVQGEYAFNPYMYAMPPQIYGKNDK